MELTDEVNNNEEKVTESVETGGDRWETYIVLYIHMYLTYYVSFPSFAGFGSVQWDSRGRAEKGVLSLF